MIVQCPKCKTKLKVDESRIKPEGSRMRCPRCSVVLMVRPPKKRPPAEAPSPVSPPEERTTSPATGRPAAPPAASAGEAGAGVIPAGTKVLVAHGNPAVLNEAVALLMGAGCAISTASDGVDAMVRAQQDGPAVAVIDVALPKIYGFEVARRLRDESQTSHVKILLVTSVHKEDRYRRDPESLYGADGYVEEPLINEKLVGEVAAVLSTGPTTGGERQAAPEPASRPAPAPPESAAAPAVASVSDEDRERARRLSRTILSDIDLYSPEQVIEAVRNDTFETVFADELREGRKLYEARISADTRAERDFYQESIQGFVLKKREQLGAV